MAPALVTSSADLIEYWVNDSSTVDPNARKGYVERFIHGEIFRQYPEVNCVVHSHAEAVLPYVAAINIPMMPVFHMAGFLGIYISRHRVVVVIELTSFSQARKSLYLI